MNQKEQKSIFCVPFFLSWIVTFFLLYTVSYIWHGVVLNDLDRVPYSKNIFYFLASVVYFCISFALTFIIKILPYNLNDYLKGLSVGFSLGVFFYLIAFVFGVSFYSNPSLLYILFDLSWQVFEESIGGIAAASSLSFFAVFLNDYKKVKKRSSSN